MKPKIDLNHPITRLAMSLSERRLKKALETEQIVESGVIPIYGIKKRKTHERRRAKQEQIASGVLVKIKNEYFIFSATHVFWSLKDTVLLTGAGKGNITEQLQGQRFSTGNIENPEADKLDASVFHIQSEMSPELKQLAIGLSVFDFNGIDPDKNVFLVSGFRVKKSNTEGLNVNSKRETFATYELEEKYYSKYNIDYNNQIIIAWEDQVLNNGNWQSSPIPKGLSGGAIVKVDGTKLMAMRSENLTPQQKLSAITIEHHRKIGNKDGYLIGTRINVHLGLVNKFLPGLMDDFLSQFNK